MPRILKKDDGFYLSGQRVENGATLERFEGSQWVADRISVFQTGGGELSAYFGEAAAVETGATSPTMHLAEDCELRWPEDQES